MQSAPGENRGDADSRPVPFVSASPSATSSGDAVAVVARGPLVDRASALEVLFEEIRFAVVESQQNTAPAGSHDSDDTRNDSGPPPVRFDFAAEMAIVRTRRRRFVTPFATLFPSTLGMSEPLYLTSSDDDDPTTDQSDDDDGDLFNATSELIRRMKIRRT